MAISRLGSGKRLRPALSPTTTGAARIVDLLKSVSVGQIGVRFAGRGLRLVDGAAKGKRIQRHVCVGAQRPADRLQTVEAACFAGVGDRKETAVASAHADRIGSAQRRDLASFSLPAFTS